MQDFLASFFVYYVKASSFLLKTLVNIAFWNLKIKSKSEDYLCN